MKIERPEAPETFAANAERWQRQLEEACDRNPRHRFEWYEVGGVSARELLLPALREMTAGHCSYCDGFHSYEIGETIDHFRPKSRFRRLAYSWPNLFLACSTCQRRGERYDERLLKPDEGDYAFERYFDFDFVSGELRPAVGSSAEDRARAETTIDLFNLNHPERCKARRRAFEALHRSGGGQRVDRPYRFILAPP